MSKGRYVRLCAVALAGIMLAGCSGKELPERGQTDGERSLEEENAGERNPEEGDTGAENPEEGDGREVSASAYPKVAKLPEDIWVDQVIYSEGCYCVFDGAHYGFMTEEGEEITSFIYEQAAPFSEGLACVCLDGKYGFIGKEGETKIPFLYDEASTFTEGLAYFRIGEDYGFMDREGQVIFRPDCDSVSSFQEGKAYFSVDGLYGYLDNAGKVLVEPVYEDAGYFQDGLAIVMRNGFYGLINSGGEEILPPVYDRVETEEGFILAEKEGLEYCFDRDGKVLLEPEYGELEHVWKGVFCVRRDGGYTLVDGEGKVLHELKDEYVFYPIPEKELIIARRDGVYGVIDYYGREKVPFEYSWISYDDDGAGGLRVTQVEAQQEGQETQEREKRGFLSFTGKDSFAEIPAVYDYMSFFEGDRAVVMINRKYGIIRRDGSLEYPLEYDSIRLFENGAAALWTGKTVSLVDRTGNAICTGTYDDITLCGKCYEVKKDRKYGLLNEQGELVIPVVYDFSYHNDVYGAAGVLNMAFSGQGTELLVKTDESVETEMPKVYLQNHITPRRKNHMEVLQTAEQKNGANLSGYGVESFRSFGKLYRMEGELVLYYYSEPYKRTTFPMSSSGFYAFRNGKVEELATGEVCGGSLRGDYICLWYDRVESRMKLGVTGSWGGFAGNAVTSAVYELQHEGAKMTADWESVSQVSGNYYQEELLENAAFFYDDEGNPYTRDTILEAEYVTEYLVDGENVSPERYAEVQDRYRYMGALGLD